MLATRGVDNPGFAMFRDTTQSTAHEGAGNGNVGGTELPVDRMPAPSALVLVTRSSREERGYPVAKSTGSDEKGANQDPDKHVVRGHGERAARTLCHVGRLLMGDMHASPSSSSPAEDRVGGHLPRILLRQHTNSSVKPNW